MAGTPSSHHDASPSPLVDRRFLEQQDDVRHGGPKPPRQLSLDSTPGRSRTSASFPRPLPEDLDLASSVDAGEARDRSSSGVPEFTAVRPKLSKRLSVLDSPGDDIEFIDSLGSESRGQNEAVGALGLPADGIPASDRRLVLKSCGHSGQAFDGNHAEYAEDIEVDCEVDKKVVSTQMPDGNIETTTTITVTKRVISPEVPEIEYGKCSVW